MFALPDSLMEVTVRFGHVGMPTWAVARLNGEHVGRRIVGECHYRSPFLHGNVMVLMLGSILNWRPALERVREWIDSNATPKRE
jgi:hypothetical protein